VPILTRRHFWKAQPVYFGGEASSNSATAAVDAKTLHAKIRELTLQNNFLEVTTRKLSQEPPLKKQQKLSEQPGPPLSMENGQRFECLHLNLAVPYLHRIVFVPNRLSSRA
jgi:hypothetical protein